MATRRQKRLDNKYRDQLRCEACNRWTLVGHETWRRTIKNLRDDHTPYLLLCSRPSCKRSRPEGFLSALSEREKDQIIRPRNSHVRSHRATTYHQDKVRTNG